MSRSQLHDGELALLGKLNRQPVELGDLPGKHLARLVQLGLVRQVLGYCEITRTGQLAYQRDHYRKQMLGPIARIAQRNPLSLFRRRTIDTHLRNTSVSHRWNSRPSSVTGKDIGK